MQFHIGKESFTPAADQNILSVLSIFSVVSFREVYLLLPHCLQFSFCHGIHHSLVQTSAQMFFISLGETNIVYAGGQVCHA